MKETLKKKFKVWYINIKGSFFYEDPGMKKWNKNFLCRYVRSRNSQNPLYRHFLCAAIVLTNLFAICKVRETCKRSSDTGFFTKNKIRAWSFWIFDLIWRGHTIFWKEIWTTILSTFCEILKEFGTSRHTFAL